MGLLKIRYFHIDHNEPCLPPNILHNHCFQFLLGYTVVPREIQDNGYAIFWGVGEGGGGGTRRIIIYVKMVNNHTRLYNNETKNCNYVALALASVHQG